MKANRGQLIDQGVIEAARRYMAAHLLMEREAGDDAALTVRVLDRDYALQDLRDALAGHSRAKKGARK